MDAQQQYKVALYGQGLFNTADNAKNVKQANQLAGSGFTTLMLFTLHVHPTGELYWGDNPIARNGQIIYPLRDRQSPSLPELLARLRQGGFTTILFSIGSADAADWTQIQQMLAREAGRRELRDNFTAVADWLGIDGFDFDCEEPNISVDTIAAMTAMLSPVGRRSIITYCPYTSEDWWIQCLEQVYAGQGSQLVSWLNLQLYAGGSGNDLAHWVAELEQASGRIGVPVADCAAFVVPGYDTSGGPLDICDALHKYVSLKLSGAFVWNAASVLEPEDRAKQYATAVANGLSGGPCI